MMPPFELGTNHAAVADPSMRDNILAARRLEWIITRCSDSWEKLKVSLARRGCMMLDV